MLTSSVIIMSYVALSHVVLMLCMTGSLAHISMCSQHLVLAGVLLQAPRRLTLTWMLPITSAWPPSQRLAQHFKPVSVQTIYKQVPLQTACKAGLTLIHKGKLSIIAA